MSPRVAVDLVGIETPAEHLRALDAILKEARRKIVPPEDKLESVDERVADADGDGDRLLLAATFGGEIAGFLDAVRHSPEPGTMTIAIIAVGRGAREKGIGRALVAEAIERLSSDGTVDAVCAGVQASNGDAIAFFSQLGLETVHDKRSGGIVVMRATLEEARAATLRRP